MRWIATRDRFSPSNETCQCSETVFPIESQPDESLVVDEFCNLVGNVPDRILIDGSYR